MYILRLEKSLEKFVVTKNNKQYIVINGKEYKLEKIEPIDAEFKE